jgi:hypothetical protein
MGYSVNGDIDAIVAVISMVFNLLGNGISIAIYVLGALGLYTIAKRRQINHPWLAWVPIASGWIVGSLSDQYRYVKKGQVKNKRKWLPILECLMAVAILTTIILMVVNILKLESSAVMSEDAYVGAVVSLVLQFLLLWLGIMAVAIARAIIHFMAMYDVYTSLNPAYNVVFLLVSIFVNVTEPFFVFFNRKKDLGMPPRNDAAPVCEIEE